MLDPYKKIINDTECLKNRCTPIIIGPTGPRGEDGTSDAIVVRSTTTTPAGTAASVIDTRIHNVHMLDFSIPRGNDGPTLLRSAYLVTFNTNTIGGGIPIEANKNIPITRKELDISNLVELDEVNGVIKFNEVGYYKVYFMVSAYPEVTGVDFDPTKDIVSIGFKETGTDNVYLGVGQFVYNGEPVELSACGIISVVDTNTTYELSNLGKYKIFLETPDIVNLSTKSYFGNPLVTLVIDYLGRQGV